MARAPTDLTARDDVALLEPRPDALYPAGVFQVTRAVGARALVFEHGRVVGQPGGEGVGDGPRVLLLLGGHGEGDEGAGLGAGERAVVGGAPVAGLRHLA